jgi:hypothetical protein
MNLESIKSCLKKSKVCRAFAKFPISLFYIYLKLKTLVISDKSYVISHYKKVFGKTPDLKNPKTINEFIAKRKVYDRDPLLTLCADKFKVREYVKEKIGKEYLIPLITYSDDIYKIDFNSLPNSFAAKVNHGSGQNMIVLDKTKENIDEMKVHIDYWMKRNHYYNTREWQYKNIKTLILFEELILDKDGSIPKDYKFHMIGGKVEFIQIDTERFNNHKRIFYSASWEELEFMWAPVTPENKPKYKKTRPMQKPKSLQEMIKISEKLSEDFDYVRVDLYAVNEKIYFGELTFTHENGLSKFFPEIYDRYFGKKLMALNNK